MAPMPPPFDTPPPAPPPRWPLAAALLALPAAFATLVLATLRTGETWKGGDFALYLMHARNLAAGLPYAATRFVFDPASALMSPAAAPPGAPFLLLPAVLAGGGELRAAKIACVLYAAAALALTGLLVARRHGPAMAALLTAALCANPVLLDRVDFIRSEPAFMFCAALALLAADIAGGAGRRLWWGLAAAAAAAAILTRPIGIAVPLGFLAPALPQALASLRRRAPAAAARALAAPALAGAVSVLGAALVSRALHADTATYLSFFTDLSARGLAAFVLEDARAYALGFAEILGLSLGPANPPLLLALVGLCALGAWRAWRAPSPLELYLPAYLIVLAVFPLHMEPTRYLLPVMPILVLYACLGARALAGRGTRVPLAAPAALLALCYLPALAVHPLRAPPPWPTDGADSRAALAALRDTAPPAALVMARNPRIVAYLADRRAVAVPMTGLPAALDEALARLRPAVVFEERGYPAPEADALSARLARGQDFVRVFANAHFAVWTRPPSAPANPR